MTEVTQEATGLSILGREIVFDRGLHWLTISGLSPHETRWISGNVFWAGPSAQGLFSFFPEKGQSLLGLMDEIIHNLGLGSDNIVMSGWGVA